MVGSRLSELLTARFGEAPGVPDGLESHPFLTCLAARGSCRAFTTDTVTDATLETLAAAALCAPSKSDLQQRDILIVSAPEQRGALRDLLSAQAWIADAPHFVIFLANNRRQRQVQKMHEKPFPNDHLDAFFNASVDAGIALALFMAAAEAAGLGCCPISTIRNHLAPVRDLFSLPDHVFPVAGMAIGYPADTARMSPRLPLSATVHNDRFSDCSDEVIQDYDARRSAATGGPAWSRTRAEMYAEQQRGDFGGFIRGIGFKTD
ncbi:nitroreductase family protein [Roseobacter sp.]|uniref:nitroreductase family protein n=1 Tax=Roseobacter sp. TaxID=1907202 RepID=UPI0025F6A297|nr:nitroreductase family protein [Roseobacter sp.]